MNKRANDNDDFDPSQHRPDTNFWFRIVCYLFGGCVLGVGWWMHVVWADTQENKKGIADVKTPLAVMQEHMINIDKKQDEFGINQRDITRKIDRLLTAAKA